MRLREVIAGLNELAPESYQESWDNSGLQIGDLDSEIHNVCIALDLDDAVVEEAIAHNADLIVTHHPLIFSPLKRITTEDFIGKRLLKLARAGISYYAMHTNFDIAKMADLAAERLQLKDVSVLDVCFTKDEKEFGIGCIGALQSSLSLAELAGLVKESFGLESVRIFGETDTKIHTIAICPGSGKSTISSAISKGADVLVTGDIDHHNGIDAVAQGLAIIDAGHYGLEHIFTEYMKEYMEQHMGVLKIHVPQTREVFRVI